MPQTLDQPDRTGMAVPLETDEESYLDFVEGLRSFNLQTLSPVVSAATGAILEPITSTGNEDDFLAAARGLASVQFRDRLSRSAQEMMHRCVLENYRRHQEELLAGLEAAERSDCGSSSYHLENFPGYVRRADIHLQPGSYDQDPLAGYHYHRTTDMFLLGKNDRGELHQAMVDAATARAEEPRRILDLGGSAGQSATALKRRFPDAEVHSVDLGVPMIRYARKRAVEMGLDIHFHQMAAEDLSLFEDGSFDLVYALLLFHELPDEARRKVVAEARRVLRPGGSFVVLDSETRSPEAELAPIPRYLRWFSGTYNGEPFMPGFASSDFEGTLAEHFSTVTGQQEDPGLSIGAMQARVAVA